MPISPSEFSKSLSLNPADASPNSSVYETGAGYDCEPYKSEREMQNELLKISSSLQQELSAAWSVANKVTASFQRKAGLLPDDSSAAGSSDVESANQSDSEDEDVSWGSHTRLHKKLMLLQRTQAIAGEAIDQMLQAIGASVEDPSDVKYFTSKQKHLMNDLSRVVSIPDSSMQRPKCALFSHSLERNGANNFILFVAKKLCEQQDFELFTPKEGPMRSDFEHLGIKVHCIPSTTPNYIAHVERTLVDGKFGMIFANTIMRAEAVEIAHRLTLPNVWVIHEAWPADQFEYYAKEVFLMQHIDASLIQRAFQRAHHIVFPAHVQRRLYASLIPQSCTCSVVYNGIPLKRIDNFRAKNDRQKVRARLGYTDNDFLVLHLGTVCKRKAQLSTAKAFRQLCDEGAKNAKLLIVGARYIREHEIKYIDEIKKEIKEGGIEDKVTIMDIQKNVLPYYSAADVVVVPSINEVLPLVVCEAMAFERPVIASNIDGIPEALSNEKEGFLIPAGDAEALGDRLIQLHSNPELRKQMARRGRQRVLRQFSYDVMGKAYRSILDDVVAEAAERHLAAAARPFRMLTLPKMSDVRGGGLDSEDGLVEDDDMMDEEEEVEDNSEDDEEEAKKLRTFASQPSPAPQSQFHRSSSGTALHARGSSPYTLPPRTSRTGSRTDLAESVDTNPKAGGLTDHNLSVARSLSEHHPIVLVDMDSTVVDFDGSFLQRWMRAHPESAEADAALVRNRKRYELEMNFELERRGEVLATIAAPGLYISMQAFDGAIDALKTLLVRGIDVRLVTAPHPLCAPTCAAEKYQWVADNLGTEWQRRVILAQDKTHVKGDILIDDKPRVVGSSRPVWKHVIFEQPWNREQFSYAVDEEVPAKLTRSRSRSNSDLDRESNNSARSTSSASHRHYPAEDIPRLRMRSWLEIDSVLEHVFGANSLA